jgi:hypothetical protein
MCVCDPEKMHVTDETQYPKFNIYQDVEAYHVIAQAARPDKVTIFYFEKELNVTTVSPHSSARTIVLRYFICRLHTIVESFSPRVSG